MHLRAHILLVVVLGLGLVREACGAPGTNVNAWQDFAWPMDTNTPSALRDCVMLVEARETSRALTHLEELRNQSPGDPAAHHLSALLFWQSGNREEATRRLITATRLPGARRITTWALAAISAQARSQAECVGWIKRAARDQDPNEVARWLQRPYFAGLCDFPPYREFLAKHGLQKLCPLDLPFNVAAFRVRESDTNEDYRVLLDAGGPKAELKLTTEEAAPSFGPSLKDPSEPAGLKRSISP